MKKPVVCMVSLHCCIRVFKQGLALNEKGYEVHLIGHQDSFGWNTFRTFTKWLNEETLINAVKMYDKLGVNIFHVHNEPDYLVGIVRQATDKPIIFDVHDLQSLRLVSEPNEEEEECFTKADGFIHVSEPCRDYAHEKHGNSKPDMVLYSYVNRKFFAPMIGDYSLHSVCYQGGLSTNEKIEAQGEMLNGKRKYVFDMRYYVPMVQSFLKYGFNVTLFAAQPMGDGRLLYEDYGAACHDPVTYPAMLAGLRPFGFGFVGACASGPLMESAMPNKLFEYMSQGVIPVALYCGEAEKFLQKHDCGIVLNNLNDLGVQIVTADPMTKRENIKAVNAACVMEDQIESLVEFYRGFM